MSTTTQTLFAYDTVLQLAEAIEALLPYREHLHGCEIEPTDFCTCGMGDAARQAKAAHNRAVEFLQASHKAAHSNRAAR